MGWTFTRGASKAKVIAERIEPWEYKGARGETLKHKVIGKVLWSVRKNIKADGKVELYIGCDLLDKHGGDWGYKPLCESVGPYYFDCPLSYLDEVPVANAEWRERVKEYHKRKNRKFTLGEVVKLENCVVDEVTITNLKPLRGMAKDRLYRLKPEIIV